MMGRGPKPERPPTGASIEAWDAWQKRMDEWYTGTTKPQTIRGSSARFDGKDAKVDRSGGTINVYYGGSRGNVPGDGHGHVKATGGLQGDNIVFWRLPESEGGRVIVSNRWDTKYGNDLRDYLSGS